MSDTTRLSLLQAARVVARRDFRAILFSRAFFFFLLGPLFPLAIGALAGGIGGQVQRDAVTNLVAVAMSAQDTAAMEQAGESLSDTVGYALPHIVPDASGEPPEQILKRQGANFAAVVTGTLAEPVVTAPADQIERWRGPVALLAATANGGSPSAFPDVATQPVATSAAAARTDRIRTAQAGQLLLFLLMMLLAGMVLSDRKSVV